MKPPKPVRPTASVRRANRSRERPWIAGRGGCRVLSAKMCQSAGRTGKKQSATTTPNQRGAARSPRPRNNTRPPAIPTGRQGRSSQARVTPAGGVDGSGLDGSARSAAMSPHRARAVESDQARRRVAAVIRCRPPHRRTRAALPRRAPPRAPARSCLRPSPDTSGDPRAPAAHHPSAAARRSWRRRR